MGAFLAVSSRREPKFVQLKAPIERLKNGHILPTGQWYAPSVVYSVILCYTLLNQAINQQQYQQQKDKPQKKSLE